MKKYRSPLISALWSVAIPGFGQLYIGDYVVGTILVILEFTINVKANLNLTILYSFKGQFHYAADTADFQWILFYPCIYAFSIWHAYNEALEINRNHNRGPNGNFYLNNTKYNGFFIGCAIGGTLGVIYSYKIGPIFCGISAGLIAGLIGSAVEKLVRKCLIKERRKYNNPTLQLKDGKMEQ